MKESISYLSELKSRFIFSSADSQAIQGHLQVVWLELQRISRTSTSLTTLVPHDSENVCINENNSMEVDESSTGVLNDAERSLVFENGEMWIRLVQQLAVFLLDPSDDHDFQRMLSSSNSIQCDSEEDLLVLERKWTSVIVKACLSCSQRFADLLPSVLQQLQQRQMLDLGIEILISYFMDSCRHLYEYQQILKLQSLAKRSPAKNQHLDRLAGFLARLKSFIIEFLPSIKGGQRYYFLFLQHVVRGIDECPLSVMVSTMIQLIELTNHGDLSSQHAALVQVMYQKSKLLRMHIATNQHLRLCIQSAFQSSLDSLREQSVPVLGLEETLSVLMMLVSVLKSDVVDSSQMDLSFELLLAHLDSLSYRVCASMFVSALIQQRSPVLERILHHMFIRFSESPLKLLDLVKCLVALIMDNDSEFFGAIQRLANMEFTDAIQRYADTKILLRHESLKNHLINAVCKLWLDMKEGDSLLNVFMLDALAVNHVHALNEKLLNPIFDSMTSRLLTKDDFRVAEKVMAAYIRNASKPAFEVTYLEDVSSVIELNRRAVILVQTWELYKIITSPQTPLQHRLMCSYEVRQKLQASRQSIRSVSWSLIFDTLSKSTSANSAGFAAKLKQLLMLVYPQVLQCMTDAQMESMIPTTMISADLTRSKTIEILTQLNIIAKSSSDPATTSMIVSTWFRLLRKTSEYSLIEDTVKYLFGSTSVRLDQVLADPLQIFTIPDWIFRSLPMFKIFLTVLKFVCSAFKHDNVITYLQRSQEVISSKDDHEAQIKKVQGILSEYDVSVLVLESSIIQRLFDILIPTKHDFERTDDEKLIMKLQKLSLGYVSSRYIEDKRLMKLINFQGFSAHLLQVYCREVRVLYTYIGFVQEQLDSTNYKVRLFACLLASHLVMEHKTKVTLELSVKIYEKLDVMVKFLEKNPGSNRYRYRNSVVPEQEFNHPMLDDLAIMIDCIVNITTAFPQEQFIQQFVPQILIVIHTIISAKFQPPLSKVEIQVISIALENFRPPQDVLGEMKKCLLEHLQNSSEKIQTLIKSSLV